MSGRPKIFSGARAIIKINGQILAYALSVRWDVRMDHKELRVIDEFLPQELMPTALAVTVSCTSLRFPGRSATALKFQPNMLNLLKQGMSSIEIIDRRTNEVILYVPQASMVRRAGTVNARQLSNETWTFKGIGFWDEEEPEEVPPFKPS